MPDSQWPLERVLDELDYLATVEHALIVEYLSLFYVFGEGPLPAEAAASPSGARSAAEIVHDLAVSEMRHLHQVNRVLVSAGRPAQVGRASSIGPAGSEIPLGPPTAGQLERLLEREHAIATAVDERYGRIAGAIDALGLFFFAPDHMTPLGELTTSLARLAPGDYLRVTRRDPASELEQTLLAVSDQHYRLILETVRASFAHEDELGELLFRAETTMDLLEQINHLLVTRGLLPAFTL